MISRQMRSMREDGRLPLHHVMIRNVLNVHNNIISTLLMMNESCNNLEKFLSL